MSPAGVVGRRLTAFSVHRSLGSRNVRGPACSKEAGQWGIWEVRPGLGVTDQGLMGLGRMCVEGEVQGSWGRADGGGGAKAEEAFREEVLSRVGSKGKAKVNHGARRDEHISEREMFLRVGVMACATGQGRGCLGGQRQSPQGLWALGRGLSQVGQLQPRGQSYTPASVVWRDID